MASHSWTYADRKVQNGPYQGPFRCSRCSEIVERMNGYECPIPEALDDATRADLNQKIEAMRAEIARLKAPAIVEPTPTTFEESVVQRLDTLESWKGRANQRLTEDAHANAKRDAKIRDIKSRLYALQPQPIVSTMPDNFDSPADQTNFCASCERPQRVIDRIHAWMHDCRNADLVALLAEGGSGCERCAPTKVRN